MNSVRDIDFIFEIVGLKFVNLFMFKRLFDFFGEFVLVSFF